jgi:hypothetical protein
LESGVRRGVAGASNLTSSLVLDLVGGLLFSLQGVTFSFDMFVVVQVAIHIVVVDVSMVQSHTM